MFSPDSSQRKELAKLRSHNLAVSTLGRLSTLWLRTPAGRTNLLRILAYHQIGDAKAFETQLRYLADQYQPITVEALLDVFDGSPLPRRSVWVTFDDGDPSVIGRGLDALNRYGIEATFFVCPGLINTSEPYWWQIVDAAAENGLLHRGGPVTTNTRRRLKKVPDPERRSAIQEIRTLLETKLGRPFTQRQLKSSQLTAWAEAGHRVGNHTWDHPLLDRCDADQQEEQIVAAHRWLSDRLGHPPVLFAYPNGNWSQIAEDVLTRLGYRAAVLFDHRLTRLCEPLRLSRLRTSADGEFGRFRAIVSGIHPQLYQMTGRK